MQASTPARTRILTTATQLFYRYGFHATGIEQIVREADVARMTLYKHFPSKEDLVLAVMDQHQAEAERRLEAILSQTERTAEQRLTLLFEQLDAVLTDPGYAGCPIINAVAEYSDLAHPLRTKALAYKQLYRTALVSISQQLSVRDPKTLTDQLFVLLEGCWVVAQVDRTQRPALAARHAAQVLIQAQQVR